MRSALVIASLLALLPSWGCAGDDRAGPATSATPATGAPAAPPSPTPTPPADCVAGSPCLNGAVCDPALRGCVPSCVPSPARCGPLGACDAETGLCVELPADCALAPLGCDAGERCRPTTGLCGASDPPAACGEEPGDAATALQSPGLTDQSLCGEGAERFFELQLPAGERVRIVLDPTLPDGASLELSLGAANAAPQWRTVSRGEPVAVVTSEAHDATQALLLRVVLEGAAQARFDLRFDRGPLLFPRPCETNRDCAPTHTCDVSGWCTTAGCGGGCPPDHSCHPLTARCVDGRVCRSRLECGPDEGCVDGDCVAWDCRGEAGHGRCRPGRVCDADSGGCVPCEPNGAGEPSAIELLDPSTASRSGLLCVGAESWYRVAAPAGGIVFVDLRPEGVGALRLDAFEVAGEGAGTQLVSERAFDYARLSVPVTVPEAGEMLLRVGSPLPAALDYRVALSFHDAVPECDGLDLELDPFGVCTDCDDPRDPCEARGRRCGGGDLVPRGCPTGFICGAPGTCERTDCRGAVPTRHCLVGERCSEDTGRCDCVEDALEPGEADNDEPARAVPISPGSYTGLTLCPRDREGLVDWYRLEAQAGERWTIRLWGGSTSPVRWVLHRGSADDMERVENGNGLGDPSTAESEAGAEYFLEVSSRFSTAAVREPRIYDLRLEVER